MVLPPMPSWRDVFADACDRAAGELVNARAAYERGEIAWRHLIAARRIINDAIKLDQERHG